MLNWNDLNNFWELVISDFGTAKLLIDTVADSLVGTPLFLSPEVFGVYFRKRDKKSAEYNAFKSDSKSSAIFSQVSSMVSRLCILQSLDTQNTL